MDLAARYRGRCRASGQVNDVIRAKIEREELEEAFYIMDLGLLARRCARFRQLFPSVLPVFPARCNMDPALLVVLRALGFSFSCESLSEAKLLFCVLQPAFDPAMVVLSNPQVPQGHLQAAHDALGIRLFAYNANTDLSRFRQLPGVKLVLQLPCGRESELSSRRVSTLADAEGLLRAARDAGLPVVGISLDTGSAACTPEHFEDALRAARGAVEAARQLGHEVVYLDVGAAFPASDEALAPFAAAVSPALERLVPPGVTLSAEPVRYLAQDCQTLAVNVISRRDVVRPPAAAADSPPPCVTPSTSTSSGLSSLASPRSSPSSSPRPAAGAHRPAAPAPAPQPPDFLLYVNEGVYGSFNPAASHGASPPQIRAVPLRPVSPLESLFACTVYGQTCDSLDCILRSARLPKLEVGDWLLFPAMGSYMACASTSFNGFAKTPVHYVWTAAPAPEPQPLAPEPLAPAVLAS